MAGHRQCPRGAAENSAREEAKRREREEAKRRERREKISMALRAVMIVWDIVWALVRDHVFQGAGPGPSPRRGPGTVGTPSALRCFPSASSAEASPLSR